MLERNFGMGCCQTQSGKRNLQNALPLLTYYGGMRFNGDNVLHEENREIEDTPTPGPVHPGPLTGAQPARYG